MHVDKFFTEHLHVDSNFLSSIVVIDIVGHSQPHGGTKQGANTKAALKDLVDSEVVRERAAALLPWRGDGGEVVFDVSDSCDEMIAFADRVRHLIPFFNKSRGKLNKLPDQQEIIVRIVCHCGELFNKGSAAELAGEALNILAHDGKYVDSPGPVVVSADG